MQRNNNNAPRYPRRRRTQETRYLEVDGAVDVVHRLQQRGGEAEVHRESRHVRLDPAQRAEGAHRQRLERHVARPARKVQDPLVAFELCHAGGSTEWLLG